MSQSLRTQGFVNAIEVLNPASDPQVPRTTDDTLSAKPILECHKVVALQYVIQGIKYV